VAGPRTSKYGVLDVAFSPAGRLLATGDGNGNVYLWSAATGQMIATLSDPGANGLGPLAFSPGGGMLATGDDKGRALLWKASR
jgi:WD40 repeat protein